MNNVNYITNTSQKGGGITKKTYKNHTFIVSIDEHKEYYHIGVITKNKDECVSVYIFKERPIDLESKSKLQRQNSTLSRQLDDIRNENVLDIIPELRALK